MSSGREVEPRVLAAERTLAAYLGFDDIVQMQRFLITWPCLEALRLSQRLVPDTGEAVFPPFVPSDFEPHDNHNESVLISVLRAMARDIRIFINSSDEYNRDRTARAIARMPSGMWLPEPAREETPLFPIMQPVQSFTEGAMVPLHRCLVMLQYLDITHGSEEGRIQYLELRENLSIDEFTITTEDVPWWMVPRL